MTGTASSTICSGRLPDEMNAATTFRRLTARACFWPLAVRDHLAELLGLGLEVDLLQQVADRLGAHAAAEVLAEAVRRPEALLELAEDRLVVLDALGVHVLEELPDLAHALGGVLDVRLGVGDVGLERLAQVLEQLRALVVVELLDVDVERLGPQVVLVVEVLLRAVGRGTPRGAPAAP